jgi:heme A synthase
MTALRRLSIAALALAFCQIVFGAIVRITGSGWGCGEHWPKCDGHWFPPFDRVDLIIEVMHRYLALGVTVAVLALVVTAWRRRTLGSVGGPGGVLRPSLLALGVVVSTALLGAATIKLRLNPFIIVAHLALAMSLLATLVVAAMRAGGLGARSVVGSPTAAKTWRVARVAAVLAFVVLVLGALTANLGAATACLGFPTCRVYASPNRGLVALQLTHRVLAFLFAFHVLGAVMALRKRADARVVKRAASIALGAIVLQILVAAALVETRLPPVLQSLHQAVGTLVWIAVVVFAALARRAADAEPAVLEEIEPSPDAGRVEIRSASYTPSVASTAIIEPTSREPEFKARVAEAERAAHAYESAMLALLAQAEAHFENVVSYEGDDVDDIPAFEPVVAVPVTSEPTVAAPADVASPVTTEPIVATAPIAEPDVAEPAIEEPPAPERATEPLSEPQPEREASPCDGDPVEIPEKVVTPGTIEQPVPQPKRPHSVAVIMARGADF